MNTQISKGPSFSEYPIFIIGAQRSGTTLLRLMLTAHPDICIPPESPFVVELEPKYGSEIDLRDKVDFFLNDLYKDEKFREWNVNRMQLRENLLRHSPLDYSRAVSVVYQTYIQQFNPDAYLWGDKNPDYISHIDTILKYFPIAKVIHIIRDIRAVYNSVNTKATLQYGRPLRTQILTVSNRWARVVNITEKYKDDKRFYTIYYEQLVSDPEEEIRKLCEWLGVNFCESMLKFYDENIRKQLIPPNRLKWHYRTRQPISTERIDAWRDELSIAEIEALEILNWRKMRKLGYRCITRSLRCRGLLKILREYLKLLSSKVLKFIYKFSNFAVEAWFKLLKHKPRLDIHPDDVFIVSYPRSGNTWVRFLLANLISYETGKPIDFHSVHKIIPDLEIESHREIIRKMKRPRIIKSHSIYNPQFKRVIYILRDGRDVMVSYYHYLSQQGLFKDSFEEFLGKKDIYPSLWHKHVESWLNSDIDCDLLVVRYEDLLNQTEIELKRIADFVGLPYENESIHFAIRNSSFENMQRIEREKGRAFGRSSIDFKFVRRGKKEDWKNYFRPAHKKIFKSYANQTLLQFGYIKDENW